MKLIATKTNEPGYDFKYIDYITFGNYTVSPLTSGIDDNLAVAEIEINGGDENTGKIPLSALFDQHITDAQFCGPNGEELYVKGDDVYKYIERNIQLNEGEDPDVRIYTYRDAADGPIVANVSHLACDYGDSVLPEFLGQIVDIFEDYADENGIMIENSDRDDELSDLIEDGEYDSIEDAREGEGLAIIYGEDYDTITDTYRNLTDLWLSELPDAPVSRSTAREYSAAIVESFMGILEERGVDSDGHRIELDSVDKDFLQDKVLDTFTLWGLCGIDTAERSNDPEL